MWTSKNWNSAFNVRLVCCFFFSPRFLTVGKKRQLFEKRKYIKCWFWRSQGEECSVAIRHHFFTYYQLWFFCWAGFCWHHYRRVQFILGAVLPLEAAASLQQHHWRVALEPSAHRDPVLRPPHIWARLWAVNVQQISPDTREGTAQRCTSSVMLLRNHLLTSHRLMNLTFVEGFTLTSQSSSILQRGCRDPTS